MLTKMTKLQANVLALMAWVDGTFDEKEQLRFRNYLEIAPISDDMRSELFKMVLNPPKKEYVLSLISGAPKEVVATTIKNAFLIAMENGHFEQSEKTLLEEIALISNVKKQDLPKLNKMLDIFYSAYLIEREIFKFE